VFGRTCLLLAISLRNGRAARPGPRGSSEESRSEVVNRNRNPRPKTASSPARCVRFSSGGGGPTSNPPEARLNRASCCCSGRVF
jgi:hypothetical protein